MTSHSPASSPELPKLPLQGLSSWLRHMAYKFPPDAPTLLAWAKEATAIAAIPLYCRDSHEASLKYVEGYEAGSAAAAQAAWRPISEAPKDGSGMLALWVHPGDSVTARNYALVEFVRGCWRDTESDDQVYTEPTYWQPLPTPPAAPTGEQA